MENLLFSTILYVDAPEKFTSALDSLKSQQSFAQKVQLLVIDPHESEEIAALCAGASNIRYLSAPEVEVGGAYELGLTQAEGTLVHFTLASATVTPNAYAQAAKLAVSLTPEAVTALSLLPMQCDTDTGMSPYKGAWLPRKDVDTVDLREKALLQPMLQAYFLLTETAKGYHFRSELHDDALYRYLMEYQLDHPAFYYVKTAEYRYTVTREDNTSTNPLQYQPWWYRPSVEEFIIPFLTEVKEKYGVLPAYIQQLCHYLIYCKYNCNTNDRNKGTIADKEEALAFADATFRAYALMDPDTILAYHLTPELTAIRLLRFFFLQGRAKAMGRDYQVTTRDNRFLLRTPLLNGEEETVPETPFSSVDKEMFRIRILNDLGGTLQLDANIGLADFLPIDSYEVYATVNVGGKITTYPAKNLDIYPLVKCFGVTMTRKHALQLLLPISKKKMEINFFFRFEGKEHPFRITFDTPNSRIHCDNDYGYWLFGGDRMMTWRAKRTLVIQKKETLFHLKRELLFCREAYQKTTDKSIARRGLWLRLLYWLLLPFYKNKHIWVTFDKQYKAGDNGEYMYQYLRRNAKEVEPYYIIKKESFDYPRLVAQDKKHILVFGTIRTQLISLMAEIYLGTHANLSAQYNPTIDYRMFTKDLQRGKYVCIQHGLTIQKIAQYQNRQFDNIRLYCLASPYELKNLSHPFYDYKPEELKMTGLARYDGLKSNDQKIILITPTWRKNVVNSNVANSKKTHNSNFKSSAYFRIYNDLINDPTLIDCAKRNGYRIIYLLHPAMSAQMEDFDRNEFVELMPATGDMSYEKILTESSLMVTDYSGVQFDFAYMRKPIVYYHPDELPPHYDAGGLIYETMGFGPIVRNHQQIIKELCAAMERGCVSEPEYIRRADDFFAFSDHNNCERIYKEIKKWAEKK